MQNFVKVLWFICRGKPIIIWPLAAVLLYLIRAEPHLVFLLLCHFFGRRSVKLVMHLQWKSWVVRPVFWRLRRLPAIPKPASFQECSTRQEKWTGPDHNGRPSCLRCLREKKYRCTIESYSFFVAHEVQSCWNQLNTTYYIVWKKSHIVPHSSTLISSGSK